LARSEAEAKILTHVLSVDGGVLARTLLLVTAFATLTRGAEARRSTLAHDTDVRCCWNLDGWLESRACGMVVGIKRRMSSRVR
jgi:hypothetical protein